MDKQKQIEEMVGDIAKVLSGVLVSEIVNLAYFLDEQGYRKIPENAVVLTREEYKENLDREYELKRWALENGAKTAEKFAEMVKEKAWAFNTDENGNIWEYSIMKSSIDEILEEITEGTV